MNKIIYLILISVTISVPAHAAILVFSPNGSYSVPVAQTLAAAAVDLSTAGKTVVVTSALSAVQSNISSASLHAWPSDRTLRVEKGGSINPTTTLTGLSDVTPQMFGAKGDGVADDYVAFKNAAKALYATGGKISVPSGTYNISQPFTLTTSDNDNKQIAMSGAGVRSTVIHPTFNSGTSVITVGDSTHSSRYFELRDFTISGDSSYTHTGVMHMYGLTTSKIERVMVSQFHTAAAFVVQPTTSDCYGNVFDQLDTESCPYGFHSTVSSALAAGRSNHYRMDEAVISQFRAYLYDGTSGSYTTDNFGIKIDAGQGNTIIRPTVNCATNVHSSDTSSGVYLNGDATDQAYDNLVMSGEFENLHYGTYVNNYSSNNSTIGSASLSNVVQEVGGPASAIGNFAKTIDGRVGIQAIPTTSERLRVGPLLSVGTGLNVGGLFIPGGDLGSVTTFPVLPNSGSVLMGWNKSAGNGETDFISNRQAGSTGGFNFYDYTNADNLTLLFEIMGTAVRIPGHLSVQSGNSTNHVICWKDSGVLGYCSVDIASDGTCGTCN